MISIAAMSIAYGVTVISAVKHGDTDSNAVCITSHAMKTATSGKRSA